MADELEWAKIQCQKYLKPHRATVGAFVSELDKALADVPLRKHLLKINDNARPSIFKSIYDEKNFERYPCTSLDPRKPSSGIRSLFSRFLPFKTPFPYDDIG